MMPRLQIKSTFTWTRLLIRRVLPFLSKSTFELLTHAEGIFVLEFIGVELTLFSFVKINHKKKVLRIPTNTLAFFSVFKKVFSTQ